MTRAAEVASRSATRKPLASPTNVNKGGSVGKGKRVVVKRGDSLSSIAQANKIKGGWPQLFALNKHVVKNANVLRVGQVLALA